MKDKKYFLKCDVYEGMFKDEKIVVFEDIENKTISGIFPDSKIKGNKLEISLRKVEKDRSLIFPPFPDSGGYGFFQGSGFYVDNNLISESG